MNRLPKRALYGIAIIIFVISISGVLPPLLSRGVQAQSSFRFVSWADTKSATSDLSRLSDQAALLNPNFTIYPGDLESSGFTSSGMQDWKEAMNGELSGDTAPNGMFDIAFPVRGNHDDSNTSGWQAYFDFQAVANFVGATNYANMPGEEDLTYSFDFENSHFIGVDVTGSVSGLSDAEINWIDADLTAAEARGLDHAFLYFHGPIYCVDGHCSHSSRVASLPSSAEALIEVFNQHPIVTATFHGHEHTYAYTYLDDTRIPPDGSFEGVTHPFSQFVTGSAGAGPDNCNSNRCDYNMADEGFVTVDVDGAAVTVTFYRMNSMTPQHTIYIVKEGVNEPPVAVGDSASTLEDAPVIVDVAANDSDPDGDLEPATANSTCANGSTGCLGATNGSLSDNADGTITYTPNLDFNGADSFVYEICDAHGECDTATVDISVTPVPDPPVANDDTGNTSNDSSVTIDVVANDTDPDGDLDPASANTTCPTCANPSDGSLLNNGDGSFTYTPNAAFVGDDSFMYQVCDDLGACDTATANITVTPPNDPPMANNDSATVDEDDAVIIDAIANDSDPDGNLDPSTVSVTTGPTDGTVVKNVDDTFTYTPDANYNGPDSFVYEICDTYDACATATVDISVTSVADAPVAVADPASTIEGVPVVIDVAGNDSDVDGDLDPGSANAISGPSNGTLVNNGNGTFRYTPNPGFIGLDNFVYEICDDTALCDTAVVSIMVDPSTPEILEVRVASGSDDAEQRSSGSMYLTSSDLELVYDGGNQTVGMRFRGITIPPETTILNAYIQFRSDETHSGATNLLIQGEDVDNAGTFTGTSNNITNRPRTTADVEWIPVPWTTKDEAGPDQRTPDISVVVQEIVNRSGWASGNSLVIIISGTGERVADSYEGGSSAAPLLHLEYRAGPPNTPPVALDDSANTAEDSAVTIDVAANDSDPEGMLDLDSASVIADASNGTVVRNVDDKFTYTPDANFYGSDSFDYEICDVPGACDTATVSITITSVNDPPVAVEDGATTSEETLVNIDVAANDSDIDGSLDLDSAVAIDGPTNGTLVDKGDGTFDYTPDPLFTGSDSFDYEICDDLGACDTATVSIMVTEHNDPPVANNDSATVDEDDAVLIDVLANDFDPDNNLDPSSASVTTGPSNGAVVKNGDNTFTYTPDAHYYGADSFVYEICDELNECDNATVDISVTSVADAPVAAADAASTIEGMAVVIDVASNDSDVDGDLNPASANTSCAGCSEPANGSLVNNWNGTFTYAPNPGFIGLDSFVYEICDDTALCDTASVSITIDPSTPETIEVRVSAGNDDGEERYDGAMNLSSSDLELVYDRGGNQIVGMRFRGVTIPQGATIVNAYVQFKVDETSPTATTNLTIQGEDVDNAGTFTSSSGNITNRTWTSAGVTWSPVRWTTTGEAGPDQRTPDISSVVQEIVNREGWTSGNSLVIIISGTGERVAESHNGDTSGAPLLHVEYRAGPPNTPPVALGDSASTPEDFGVTIYVAANDSDPEGMLDASSANTSCTGCSDPSNGTLVNNGDGTFRYTPAPDYNGSDSFVYEICDVPGACDTATVSITITPVNDPPLAVDDAVTTSEDTLVNIDVADNDSDADGDLDLASANVISGPTNGSVVKKVDNTFDYTPDPGITGGDSFDYEICDDGGLCDTATVSITVTEHNDPPLAVNDSATTDEDTAVIIDVLANDSDPDNNLDPASASVTAGPSNGTVVKNGDNTFTFTPDANFYGADSFVYEICDDLTECDSATADIIVTSVADAPVAAADAASTIEGMAVVIDVAANDSDVDGDLDPGSANAISGPSNGTLVSNGNGTFTYTPNPTFIGVDSFVYQICDDTALCGTASVSIVVDPSTPEILEVRVASGSDDAEQRSSGSMYLTSSDLELVYDGGNQTVGMRFREITIPPDATILNAYIQFRSDETHSGATNLLIQGEDVDNAGTFTSSSNSITNRPRTTADVEWIPVPWTTKDEAGPDQRTPDISVVVQEIVNRSGWASGNSLVIIISGTGERVADSYEGGSSAAPQLHVEYRAGPPNTPPVALDDSVTTPEDFAVTIYVAANDSDPDGVLDASSANTSCTGCAEPSNGTLVNNGDGTFRYTPDPDYNGSDGFAYQICDTLGACDTAGVSITITSVNDPPLAVDDAATTSQDTLVTIDVASNDSDVDGSLDLDSVTVTNDPLYGDLVYKGDGTFDYAPNPGYIGSDSFDYEICDLGGLCDTATVSITITEHTDPPLAVNDSATTDEDTAVIIDVLANDSDPDGNLDPDSVSVTTGPGNGTVVKNGDNTFTYTPDANFYGADSFVYEICDELTECDSATVDISVTLVADAPVALADAASTIEGMAVVIDVAGNDSDVDGDLDPSSATRISGPSNGTLVNNGNGTFTYTPNPGFIGVDSFVYESCDATALCDTASVSITVDPSTPETIEVRVASGSDDAEERSSGSMYLTSSDLELVYDGGGNQIVGMRFRGITIPPGATILNAYVQFRADETHSGATNLLIQGEDVDNAGTFTSSSRNITNRPRTAAEVEWIPVSWTTKNEAGPDQRTPDISVVVQEIVNRSGWASGNSLVIIISGTGERVADSYEGGSSAAPQLHVEYRTGSP